MKIITVAFIFQFLLSCWPKVDIISRIRGIMVLFNMNAIFVIQDIFNKIN